MRWDNRGTVRAGDYIFFSIEKEIKIISWEQNYFVCYITVSAVKSAELVCDRKSLLV